MIYPQKQIKMEIGTEELKKQALKIILSLYLNRTKSQEIEFLKENFGSTEEIAKGIRTSLSDGLTQKNVKHNRIIYGENEREEPKKSQPFLKIIAGEFLSLYFILAFLMFFPSFVYGTYNSKVYFRSNALYPYLMMFFAAFIRILVSYVFSRKLTKSSIDKNKNATYFVNRGGKYMEIEESQIVVGDIMRLGFKQEVPTSGILISHNSIFVKEGHMSDGSERIQNKMSLEDCLKKLETMSNLELTLAFEQQNFPSPIVLRGSELVQGSTFWVMVISVSDVNLMEKEGLRKKDIFSCVCYQEWANRLVERWRMFSLGFLTLFSVALILSWFLDRNLYSQSKKDAVEQVINAMVCIGAWTVVLNVANLKTFLHIYLIRLMISIQVTEKLEKLLSVERIICNEKNIVELDQILIENIAVCEKKDVIELGDLGKLDPMTAAIIKEIFIIFQIGQLDSYEPRERPELEHRIIHVNKKKFKIVSSVIKSNSGTGIFKNVFKEIVKINDENGDECNLRERANDKKFSMKLSRFNEIEKNFLGMMSVPNLTQDDDRIEEIIHNRCQIKYRGVMKDILKIAEKGYRTYYFQAVYEDKIEQCQQVVVNGKIELFSREQKDRVKMMAKQVQLIYGLTPIMIGYNEGSYNEKSMKIFVALLGITISENNKVITYLKEFENVGIRSMITMGKEVEIENFTLEEQIMHEYKERNWLTMAPNELHRMEDIKKKLGRLVCQDCLIANCDCRNKTLTVSNVQPFLAISDSAKVVYNVGIEDYQYLESSCAQLRYGYISINSQNSSALPNIEALNETLLFVEGLKRNLILFYFVPLFFFCPQIIFWMRGIQMLQPRQMCMMALLYQIQLFCLLIVRLEMPASETQKYSRDKIQIINKRCSIFLYTLALLVVGVVQLLHSYSDMIPQVSDPYDVMMEKYGIDRSCKYGPSGGVTNQFTLKNCSLTVLLEETWRFESFPRISQLALAFIQLCLILVMVFRNRNYRSPLVVLGYVGSFVVLFLVTTPILPFFCPYRWSMSWVQWFIVIALAILTCSVAYGLSWLINSWAASEYLEDELSSKIQLGEVGDERHYSRLLKEYHNLKKSSVLASQKSEATSRTNIKVI